MGKLRLHGIRKQKRDQAIKRYEFEYPHLTHKEIADRWGLSRSTVSEILNKERS